MKKFTSFRKKTLIMMDYRDRDHDNTLGIRIILRSTYDVEDNLSS